MRVDFFFPREALLGDESRVLIAVVPLVFHILSNTKLSLRFISRSSYILTVTFHRAISFVESLPHDQQF